MTTQIGSRADALGALEDTESVVLLIFRVDGREHALPIDHVVEVVRMVAVSRMPDAPPWINGVINFRGRVIALIDVRIRLGAPICVPNLSTPIVVVETHGIVAGLVVDEVVEVLAIQSDAVDAPGLISAVSTPVSGVARHGDRLIHVLDRDRLCDGSVDLGLPIAIDVGTREAGR